ncbi:hypothetical protein KAR91_12435 [Candidatus Pacearchaeota archaeon]|nr:hypothetical protein [Candidatus Pacearchaeota archaeon]
MELKTQSGKPFKTEAAAKKAIFGKTGFAVIESDGGWIGIEIVPLAKKSLEERNQAILSGVLSDSEREDNKPDEEIPPCIINYYSGLDVQCPGCGQCYHETTKQYNPDIDANPAMLELKEPYVSWGWTGMPNDPSMGYGCLECPDCGTALSPSGTLRIKNA